MQAYLDGEKAVVKRLEKQYRIALNDINEKIAALMGKSEADMPHIIYRTEYQKALKAQVEAILAQLQANEFETISDYLAKSYEDGYIAAMYMLHKQQSPLILPIDQAMVAKAVQIDSKINGGLYARLGVDAKLLKKTISSEITRGIASNMLYSEIVRNITNAAKAPLSRVKTIVRTEAGRIQEQATMDAANRAKSKGADVVKQWSAVLDGKTRPTHRRLHRQIRELDEPFEIDGKQAMQPHDFGDPAEDCNCRCTTLIRARDALDGDELARMQRDAAYWGLDKAQDFEDFKRKYMKAIK